MAYDAATGTRVLFGGASINSSTLGDTWTWDGSTWTQQARAVSPSPRWTASMAYDAATAAVVLFGGCCGASSTLHDTWTWDGSTWTKQALATRPPDRAIASMAYDAATGTVVLFGGEKKYLQLPMSSVTWTWDGTTWTRQPPAASLTARSTRQWLMTRPPATSSCSAAPASTAASSVTPGLGWLRLAPPEPVPRPCQADGQLTRRSFRYRELQDLRPCPACRWRPTFRGTERSAAAADGGKWLSSWRGLHVPRGVPGPIEGEHDARYGATRWPRRMSGCREEQE